ncbi:hypothetical protein ACFXJJ_31775, partial [Streptomyces sp. NPDC059233]
MAAAEQDGPGRARRPGGGPPATGPGERLALNGMGSFEWDLDAGAMVLDEAGMAVVDVTPEEFDGTPEGLGL